MLVYGDIRRIERPATVCAALAAAMVACTRMPPGLRRHAALVRAFIATGELVQGLADQEFERKGADDVSKVQEAGARLLLTHAQAVMQSWQNNFGGELLLANAWKSLLEHLDSGEPVQMKETEGFAFYALYPESYLQAALSSQLTSNTVVIGLRSIGVTLAALVAAALGSGPAFSLRPTGHPFQRRMQVTAELSGRILADPESNFAIVDEGPGLSGSSFGSVADWLEAHGVKPHRLHFFPSHAGEPGPRASTDQRQRWRERARYVVSMDDVIIRSPKPVRNLQTWVSELVGVEGVSWQDLSGGVWRGIHYAKPGDWPPSHIQMEKRKFLMRAGDQSWLIKFAGLSDAGSNKARRGTLLNEAGFTPDIVGACYGFTVERWVRGTPADAADLDRSNIIDQLARYLGFRARHMSAPNSGASLDELCHMAVFNVEKARDSEAAGKLRQLIGNPDRLVRRLRRIDSDNRLHRWEWLVTATGQLLKTDALDHNCAHDMIGCQDVAWDVAGACVEFDLSAVERDRLADIVSQHADCDLRDDLLTAFEACYLAFQIGLWTGARNGIPRAETARIDKAAESYLRRLQLLLSG
ncbi:hypothetical protein HGP14_23955 [Rhizobium sp. P32RR-XVIII]|nr:hypothetical protein [Rhizobium sp. P32RR-XVIII]